MKPRRIGSSLAKREKIRRAIEAGEPALHTAAAPVRGWIVLPRLDPGWHDGNSPVF